MTERAGAWVWVACLQFFVAEAFAAAALPGYSYRFGFISDLGAQDSARHAVMNGSFVLQGALIATGLALSWGALGRGGRALGGKVSLAVCALGVALVGLAPEDVASGWHHAGAASHLVASNLGAMLIGRRGGVVAGAIGFAACLALWAEVYGGLGVGIVERLASYPFLLWLAGFGAAVLIQANRVNKY